MATIYLIRHGQASFGSDNYDKLSPLGCRQAQVTGEYLRDSGVVFDAVYSGDLERQRETARLATASQPGEVPHHIDPRFNEVRNDEQLEHLDELGLQPLAVVQVLGRGADHRHERALDDRDWLIRQLQQFRHYMQLTCSG